MSRVARYQADRTNQKIYFSKLACQAAEQASQRQFIQAHTEAAVLHLYGAFLAYLQELTHYYKLSDAAPTLMSIEVELAARGQVSPEITQLNALAQTGFLKQLFATYSCCQYSPAPPLPEYDADSQQLIVQQKQNMQPWLPDHAVIAQWNKELLSTITTFRAEMVEF